MGVRQVGVRAVLVGCARNALYAPSLVVKCVGKPASGEWCAMCNKLPDG